MYKLLSKFCILFVGLTVFFGLGYADDGRCAPWGNERSIVDKFEDGQINPHWYDNRVVEHSDGDQDRINAIAADVVYFTDAEEVNVRTCDGIQKIQAFLENDDNYNWGDFSNPHDTVFYDRWIDWMIWWGTFEWIREYCNIALNTRLPFLGRCIRQWESGSAFTYLIGWLMKIILTLVIIGAIIVILAGGVLMASSGGNQWRFDNGKEMVQKAVVWLIVLGLVSLLLHMINPNFFM